MRERSVTVPRASIFAKTMRDVRWQVAGFGLALFAMSSTSVFLWPSARDTLQNIKLPDAVQAFLGSKLSIATAAGYLSARFFSWVPVLLIVYAVIQGTGAIAGEESSGTIDLLLAQPVSRRSMVLQKAAAVCAGSALIVSLGWAGFLISIPFVDIKTTLGDTAIASANMLPITLLFFALSLWLGAVAPNRAGAAGGAVAAATASYFINTLATGVDALRDLKYATPFYYYGSGLALVEGIAWAHVALLLGLALGYGLLALRAFDRRDIAVGGATDLDLAAMLRRVIA